MSHTKGPWRFIDATKVASMQYKPMCVIRSGDKQIAEFSWNDNSQWFPTKDESQDNARLIAAAPELLEALKAITDCVMREGLERTSDDNETRAADKFLELMNCVRTARSVISKAEGRDV